MFLSQGAVITPAATIEPSLTLHPSSVMTPLTQQMNHLSLAPTGAVSVFYYSKRCTTRNVEVPSLLDSI